MKELKDKTSMVLWIDKDNMKKLVQYQSAFYENCDQKPSRNEVINLAMHFFFELKHNWPKTKEKHELKK